MILSDIRETPLETHPKATAQPAVSSHNEWDLLEEVVVGILDGATVPSWEPTIPVTMPRDHWSLFKSQGGRPFPPELVAAAKKDLEELVHILEGEGAKVRRPDPIDFSKPYSSPDWSSPGGLYAAMPRDLMIVIGNQILETPLAWRSRFFEIHAFRSLLKEYFHRGARWTAAPRPQLSDALYRHERAAAEEEREFEVFESVLTEFEPTFDAADFARMGRDLFAQRSHVTNDFGIEWLRRHLGPDYRIHILDVDDTHPMHIDATFVPMAPGKVLVNPERIKTLPPMFDGWDVIPAPPPEVPAGTKLYFSSPWVAMNLLSLDEERVLVEKNEQGLARLLSEHGFKPILCPFTNFYAFGGSFHCATLDVRRRGELQSYF
jgi:glycine amidinotransferase